MLQHKNQEWHSQLNRSLNRPSNRPIFISLLGLGLLVGVSACARPAAVSESPNTSSGSASPSATTAPEGSPATTPSPAVTPSNPAGNQSSNQTLDQVVAQNGSFNTLQKAVRAAGLETEVVNQPGPYTVFAPTDQAFAALPADTQNKLFQPENQAKLRRILSYHAVRGNLPPGQIQSGQKTSLEGQPLTITANSGQITAVDSAKIVQPGITARNGVIYGIDRVLIPPDVQL